MNRYTHNIIHVELEEPEASRERSSAIFGNRYFVDVVLAVDHLSGDDRARVTMRMVASETTISDSLVRQVMERLHDAGLVSRGTTLRRAKEPPLLPGPAGAALDRRPSDLRRLKGRRLHIMACYLRDRELQREITAGERAFMLHPVLHVWSKAVTTLTAETFLELFSGGC